MLHRSSDAVLAAEREPNEYLTYAQVRTELALPPAAIDITPKAYGHASIRITDASEQRVEGSWLL